MPVHYGFFVLFQFCEDFIGTHAFGKQFFQNGFRFCLFRFLCSLSICLCLLRFQRYHFFFGLLQSSLLLFQFSLQRVNVGGDGCDFGSQGSNRFLLLCDLGCVVFGDIDFGTVFAAFRSGHGDNLFLFLFHCEPIQCSYSYKFFNEWCPQCGHLPTITYVPFTLSAVAMFMFPKPSNDPFTLSPFSSRLACHSYS